MKVNKYGLLSLLIITFLLRLFPFDYPIFTADEARIAARASTLTKHGTDELGRKFPYIFNSLDDYQLPVVSYLTTGGVFLFGKNDLGVRMPFILVGTLLIFYIYKLSQLISKRKKVAILAAVIGCFSPGLIFFSKFPNEFIVAALLLTILLNLLLSEKLNKVMSLLTICLMLLTTKIFWFSLVPIVIFTLFINKKLVKNRIFILTYTVILNLSFILIYIKIPQGIRSLIENNFSTINDITVKNGIERLRSQSLSEWPSFLDKILFSKGHLLIAGFFNWFSHFNLSFLFGQLENGGKYGFFASGVFPKIEIIPFVIGLLAILKSGKDKFWFLLIYIFLITFSLLFVYPTIKIGYLILVIPFIIILISNGLENLRRVSYVIVFFAVLEVLANLFFIQSSIKNSFESRPVWIKQAVNEIYHNSLNNAVYVSDNSTVGLLSFIEWYTPIEIKQKYENVDFPYKFYEGEILNIKTLGSSNKFVDCDTVSTALVFATKRDVEKLSEMVIKIYKNDLGVDTLYLVKTNRCIK